MPGKKQRPTRLGEKLRAIREKLGYSYAEMADKVSDEDAWIHRNQILRYEAGTADPTLIILLRYSRLTRIRMEIFADDDLELPDKWQI